MDIKSSGREPFVLSCFPGLCGAYLLDLSCNTAADWLYQA
jgi:hypothetical protein